MARLLRAFPATTGLSGRGSGSTFLRSPVVVGEGTVYPPVQGYLFPISDVQTRVRKGVHSRLRPPAVVTPAVQPIPPTIAVNLAPRNSVWRRSTQRTVEAKLFPPAVVGAGIVSQRIRGRLFPAGTTAEITRRRRTESRLGPPTVVTQVVAFVAAPVATSLAYSRRGTAKSVLRKPTDTVGLEDQGHVKVTLAASRRGRPTSRIRGPVVVTQPTVASPITVKLAASARQGRAAHGFVGRPVVTFDTVRFFGPAVHLAYSRRGAAKPRLGPAAVVSSVVVVYYGPRVTFAAKVARRSVRSTYVFPIVVFREQALGWVAIQLVRRPNPKTTSRLLPPVSVTAVVAQTYYGPRTPFARNRPRRTTWFLRPPVIPPVARPVDVTLVASRRGRASYRLEPPTVVYLAVEIYGPAVELAYSVRKRGAADLRPPTVVDVRVYSGPAVTLAYSVRGKPRSRLAPATVIDLSPQVYYLSTTFARIRPSRTVARLEAPVVVYLAAEIYGPTVELAYSVRKRGTTVLRPPTVVDRRVYFGPLVHLTYSRRGAPKSVLHAPTVIDVRPQTYYLSVTLAPSRDVRHLPHSRLAPPAVVQAREVVFYGPTVSLAPSVRGRPIYGLRGPVLVDGAVVYEAAKVTLAYSRRGAARSRLLPPIVAVSQVYYGPSVTLAYSRRGAPKSTLRPPVIPPLAEPTRVTLAYSRRGVAKYDLRGPTVVDLRPQTYYLAVTLVRNKPQPTTSFLRPSAVTEGLPRAERDLRVYLAYSVRGRPKSVLRKPVVIDVRPQTSYLSVNLAYSVTKRGRAVLRQPVVVARFAAAPVTVTLAYSLRGTPKSRLEPPVVVRFFVAAPVRVELAYSRRGRPVYKLRAPVVVGRVVFFGPVTTLAPQRRGTPKPFLTPPTVVRVPENRATRVTLVRIRPVRTLGVLRAPTAVRIAENRPTRTTFTRITPPPVHSRLFPPALIDLTPQTYYLQVTLVRIVPPPTIAVLRAPAVVNTFHPPGGDVCGFDIAGSFVCDETTTDSGVTGTDEQGSVVQGSDTPESRISGDDTAVDEVCGTDDQAL